MKITYINSMNFGSTGNICLNLANYIRHNGNQSYICVPYSRSNAIKEVKEQIFIGNRLSRNLHELLGYLTGLQGFFSVFSTLRFLKKIEKISPDIIHLHNLHNCYINIPLLFRFIKKKDIPVVWTLHDCCSFTGKCSHFVLAKCDDWRTGCHKCPQLKRYPKSMIDATGIQWKAKKKWFSDVKSMTIVAPSEWLGKLIEQSFLKRYPIKVIHNGIDLEVFTRTSRVFRRKVKEKYVILGVSMTWGYTKGLDVFLKLSHELGDDYRIVLVGIDGSELEDIPDNVTVIKKTRDQHELADLYSSADIFVNPTREDNFPTVNIEALACGTPVVTFDTGGSPEIINQNCGSVVTIDDFDKLISVIQEVCVGHPYRSSDCQEQAQLYGIEKFCSNYESLYEEVLNKVGSAGYV